MTTEREQAEMHTDDCDAMLVLAARDGDAMAFAELLTRHRPMLLALCRRMLDDVALAEDAAQEASLQALRSLVALEQPDRFGSWLAGIGLNICRRWLRERARACPSWEALQDERRVYEPSDSRPGPEEVTEGSDIAARVRCAIGELPHGQQAAVGLFYLDGLTHAETAAALGIEVGAVKTRLHKARGALRQRLSVVWKMVDGYAGTALRATEGLVAPPPQTPVPALVPVEATRRLPHRTLRHST